MQLNLYNSLLFYFQIFFFRFHSISVFSQLRLSSICFKQFCVSLRCKHFNKMYIVVQSIFCYIMLILGRVVFVWNWTRANYLVSLGNVTAGFSRAGFVDCGFAGDWFDLLEPVFGFELLRCCACGAAIVTKRKHYVRILIFFVCGIWRFIPDKCGGCESKSLCDADSCFFFASS